MPVRAKPVAKPAPHITPGTSQLALANLLKAEAQAILAGKSPAQVVAAGQAAFLSVAPTVPAAQAKAIATQNYAAYQDKGASSTVGQIVGNPGADFGQGVKDILGGTGLTGWEKTVGIWLKIGAGGLGIVVSGLALVYVAGRNTSGGKALTGAAGAVASPVKGATRVARKATPERSEARKIARATRTRNRSERANSRVVTTPAGKTKITSRKEGARSRDNEAAASYERSESRRRDPSAKGARILRGVG